jgi:hypothetical protein
LRIISEELWTAAHARLGASRETYLARTDGERHGRPVASRPSPYLLSGLSRCAACGGGLIVRSRASSAGRLFVYWCGHSHQRGATVCSNTLLASMAVADRAVLDTIEADILAPEVIARTLEKAAALMAEPAQDRAARHRALADRLAKLTAEVARFTEAIGAGGGDLASILKALRERDDERQRVEAELDALLGAADVATLDVRRIRRALAATLDDWRAVLGRQTTEAREAPRVLLADRIAFTPAVAGGRYTLEGRVVVGRLITGMTEAAYKTVGGPNGIRTRVYVATLSSRSALH